MCDVKQLRLNVLYFLFPRYYLLMVSNGFIALYNFISNVQDAGSPHMGCQKKCCENLFSDPDPTRKVISLGIVDPKEKKILDDRSNTRLY